MIEDKSSDEEIEEMDPESADPSGQSETSSQQAPSSKLQQAGSAAKFDARLFDLIDTQH